MYFLVSQDRTWSHQDFGLFWVYVPLILSTSCFSYLKQLICKLLCICPLRKLLCIRSMYMSSQKNFYMFESWMVVSFEIVSQYAPSIQSKSSFYFLFFWKVTSSLQNSILYISQNNVWCTFAGSGFGPRLIMLNQIIASW